MPKVAATPNSAAPATDITTAAEVQGEGWAWANMALGSGGARRPATLRRCQLIAITFMISGSEPINPSITTR
jgi:hypothetical protein